MQPAIESQGSVLVIGADGVIGRALATLLEQRGHVVLRTTRRGGAALPLDIARDSSVWPIPEGVTSACLCAAITATTACQKSPKVARSVNVDGTVTLAQRLGDMGIHVVFPSSNMVFDGAIPHQAADADPCPVTAYGEMKAEAEELLLGTVATSCVVRLSKVIEPDMPLLAGWLNSLQAQRPIHPFSDLSMAPIPLRLAADLLARSCVSRTSGILQLSARDEVTYAEAANYLVTEAGLDGSCVQPTTAIASGLPREQVVLHTTLDSGRSDRLFGIPAPSPWVALDDVAAAWKQYLAGFRSPAS